MNRSAHPRPLTKPSLPTTLCATGLLLALLLSLVSAAPYPGAPRTRLPAAGVPVTPQDTPPPCCGSEEDDDKPHLLAASYYSLKDSLRSKLLLNNKGPLPLEVRPMLFSMGGERYEVAPVTVEGNSFQLLDLRGWADAAGPQFREGSIQVFHLGRDLVLGAQVYVEDEARGLSFEEKFAEPATMPSSRLRGVWWLPSPRGEVRLAVSNTSDAAVTVTAHADGARPALKGSVSVELLPHETRLLDVGGDLFGPGRGAMSRLGGISVEHTGPAGAVLARGFARDAAAGYSLSVQFSDPQGAKSSAYQGAGLRLGAAGGEALTPVAVAHNAGTAEAVVTGRLPYTKTDGLGAEVVLPETRLAPGETAEIDIAGAMRSAGVSEDVSGAGLEFEYTGEPGGVQMTALSLGEGGGPVFRVPMWDVAAQRSATGGYPWFIEGDSSTVVYLKNATALPQEYTLQISHEGGTYVLGSKTIEPRQTTVLDLRDLRDGQTPDALGATLPPGAARGQIAWSVRGPDGLAMIGRSEQFDAARGVSSSYACVSCCPQSFYSASVVPVDVNVVGVGATTQFRAMQTDKNCYGQIMTPYPTGASWASANSSIATASNGAITGVQAGTTGIQANWTGYVWTVRYSGGACDSFAVSPRPAQNVNVASVAFQKGDGSTLPTPLRVGISSVKLDGTAQNRAQQLKALVSPASMAEHVMIIGNKVQISDRTPNNSTGVVTFKVVGITPSEQPADGSIRAEVGSTPLRTHPITVVVPAKLTHDAGGSLIIQNKPMNVTTSPPAVAVPATQMLLNTLYYKSFTVTVKDKWDMHVGDLYAGAEVTEVVGNNDEASINSPVTASGTFIDPVGRIAPGAILVPATDPRVAAWPSQPKLQALQPGLCSDTGTQNIEVFVAGFELAPAIARSVVLCRNQSGTYTLEVTWP